MEQRIRLVNPKPMGDSGPVLYWMQAAQRIRHNYALGYSIELAAKKQVPLVVVFCLTAFPEANLRHYWFMWQGIRETAANLSDLGIPLVIYHGHPEDCIPGLARRLDASAVVTEKAYLRTPRHWRSAIYPALDCQAVEVESEVVVPLHLASTKEAYSAASIRRRVTSMWNHYISDYELPSPAGLPSLGDSLPDRLEEATNARSLQPSSITQPDQLASLLGLSPTPGISPVFQGGATQAQAHLDHFLNTGLHRFAQDRSDPSLGVQSNLSPYLHFGQISPVDAALQASQFWKGPQNRRFNPQLQAVPLEPLDAFLEELIVRRELSFNYVYYNPRYDEYEGLPSWALKTLAEHREDPRPYEYSYQELEAAQTHDPYWNASQREMVITGKMAGYMRMYWGKKILEWTRDPKTAFNTALKLNNTYELDGRDPSSFAGVAWCFGKHDRPWAQRAIFGTVRYMNDRGLERKFNIRDYAGHWNHPNP
ncbi:deoxyribodipyrimidine photo-lyase [Spirochaeta lutea]|uniref:Deoxyribodipyrimidine photo-lyase n=1 Tax=Spirochaeta lutea TaxID=1480694 RepID=A0A098QYC5_9SPIO|nr:deoxyribodipyrimidine photo-lyase [Spirochaeta lutea]KGE72428.1 hypothetical protein DC28_07145 [Spirochaeta lutea]